MHFHICIGCKFSLNKFYKHMLGFNKLGVVYKKNTQQIKKKKGVLQMTFFFYQ